MKRHPHRRPSSVSTYLFITLACLLFAVAQPASSLGPESVAVALVDLSGSSAP